MLRSLKICIDFTNLEIRLLPTSERTRERPLLLRFSIYLWTLYTDKLEINKEIGTHKHKYRNDILFQNMIRDLFLWWKIFNGVLISKELNVISFLKKKSLQQNVLLRKINSSSFKAIKLKSIGGSLKYLII